MKITARTAMVVAVLLLFTAIMLPVPSGAASYNNYEKALDLKILGLLANAPESFELGRAPTRIEGAVMLVRLLGKENIVKQGSFSHPFADVPAWADSYVGYMYESKLTNGIGDSRFGSANILSANQYVTFVLRSLGYDDKTDFQYDKALDKALQTGLLSAAEGASLKDSTSFIRNDMVGISYNALSVKLKASNQTLLDKLVNTDKAVFKPAARVLGLYTSELKPEFSGVTTFKPVITSYGSTAKNKDDLFKLLRKAMYLNEEQLKVDARSYNGSITNDFGDILDRASDAVTEITGVENFISSWKYVSSTNTFTVTLQYRYTKSDFNHRRDNTKAALNKARYTVGKLISTGLSDYDKEKKLHDYLINTTRYDYQNYLKDTLPDESFTAYGCLVKGVAVCEGYSRAMKLLCDLSSLECTVVSGKSKNGSRWEGHAWNIVKVDGEYYHLDVTNDDPVSKDGGSILAYYYFNLPDSEMLRTSTWDKANFPACTSTVNSYYYKNSMVAESRSAFDKAVQAALALKKTMIELKVGDYSDNNYSNLSELVFKTNAVVKYNSLINEELGIIRIYNIQYS